MSTATIVSSYSIMLLEIVSSYSIMLIEIVSSYSIMLLEIHICLEVVGGGWSFLTIHVAEYLNRIKYNIQRRRKKIL